VSGRPRIALLAADLTAGHSGIADHSLQLARALVGEGAEVAPMALAAAAGDAASLALTLPAGLSWSTRMRRLRLRLDSLVPDWVFLQLAPDLYHPRGWLGRLTPGFERALAGRRLAVMVHELGRSHALDGLDPRDPQRRRLVTFLRRLRPERVFTTTAAFRQALSDAGLAADLLPLFSHLPVTASPPGPWFDASLADAGLGEPREVYGFIGLFGRVWADWRPEAAIERAAAAARRAGLCPVVLLIGRHGLPATRLESWRRALPEVPLVDLGPRPAGTVSQLLNQLHLLLTPTPFALLGKASTVAAAAAQGLPVQATRGSVPLDGDAAFAGSLLLPPGADPAPAFARRPGSGPFRRQAAETARLLLAALGDAGR